MFQFYFIYYSLQTLLAKAKEELEAEKRELVRTLERRSSEVEHLNGVDRHSSCCLCLRSSFLFRAYFHWC